MTTVHPAIRAVMRAAVTPAAVDLATVPEALEALAVTPCPACCPAWEAAARAVVLEAAIAATLEAVVLEAIPSRHSAAVVFLAEAGQKAVCQVLGNKEARAARIVPAAATMTIQAVLTLAHLRVPTPWVGWEADCRGLMEAAAAAAVVDWKDFLASEVVRREVGFHQFQDWGLVEEVEVLEDLVLVADWGH